MILTLWLGCGDPPSGDSASDSAAADVAVDACEAEVTPPDAVATEACDDQVCSVAAGPFVMGRSDPATPDRCPARVVELAAFDIDRYEVTVERWQACLDAGACDELPSCPSEADVRRPEALPVTCVTWTEASDFCSWAGGRLPTEAEWEKAARGPQGSLFPWGDTTLSCDRANYHDATFYCQGGPVEVDRGYEPGAYGLVQAAGNVWEWVADAYDAGWYRDAPDVDPPGPESCAPEVGAERGECTTKVLRGGSWNSVRDVLEVDTRSFATPDLIDDNVGFRCAY